MIQTYEIDGKSITASEAWDIYVGEQTPREFMENSAGESVFRATGEYIDSAENCADLDDESKNNLWRALEAYADDTEA